MRRRCRNSSWNDAGYDQLSLTAASAAICEIIGAQMIIASCTFTACSHTGASASMYPTRHPIIPNDFEKLPMTTTFCRHWGADAALQCAPS